MIENLKIEYLFKTQNNYLIVTIKRKASPPKEKKVFTFAIISPKIQILKI
jgi:hypothetical protein